MPTLRVFLLMACSATAFAEPSPNSALKPWLKTWTCAATNKAGEKVAARLTFKPELDGHWFVARFESGKTRSQPAFVSDGKLGFEPVRKRYIMVGYDNLGGWIDLQTKAVTATAMTFEGDSGFADGRKEATKFALTLDGKALRFVGTVGASHSFEYTCR